MSRITHFTCNSFCHTTQSKLWECQSYRNANTYIPYSWNYEKGRFFCPAKRCALVKDFRFLLFQKIKIKEHNKIFNLSNSFLLRQWKTLRALKISPSKRISDANYIYIKMKLFRGTLMTTIWKLCFFYELFRKYNLFDGLRCFIFRTNF